MLNSLDIVDCKESKEESKPDFLRKADALMSLSCLLVYPVLKVVLSAALRLPQGG